MSDNISPVYLEARQQYKNKEITKEVYEPIRKEYTYFGYKSLKRFWASVGTLLLLSFISVLFLNLSLTLKDKHKKRIYSTISISSTLVSFYFLTWAFWYRADLPKTTYYILIGVLSVLSLLVVYGLIRLSISIREEKQQREKKTKQFIKASEHFITEFSKELAID